MNKYCATHTQRQIAYGLTVAGADLVAWWLAYVLVVDFSGITTVKYQVLGLAWGVWMAIVARAYTRRVPFWTELGKTLQAWLILTVVGALLKLTIGNPSGLPDWLQATAVLLFAIPLMRWVAKTFLAQTCLGWNPALIFGNAENAAQAKLALNSEPNLGLSLSGFVVPESACGVQTVKDTQAPNNIPWPVTEADFAALQRYHCIVALEAQQSDLRDQLIRQLTQFGITHVYVIPAMRGVPLFGLQTTQFFSHEVLMIHVRNNLSRPLARWLKRAFDFAGAAALLAVLSPVFAVLAYKVSRDGGAPFFGHTRIGQNGKPFKCYKFRSMVVNAQQVLEELLVNDPAALAEWAKDFKLKNDPRINRIGHFLRKTSLDELPQLWNVLKGEMSLVGPRPVVQEELERYANDLPFYLMVKPGMTGLWQVSGRNDVDYETRVYFDAWYVKNWSLWTDIAILFKTINVVFGRSGAY